VIKSFLCNFADIHSILWAVKGPQHAGYSDDDAIPLCRNYHFKLYIHQLPEGRAKPQQGELDIVEYEGSMSKFATSARPTVSTSKVRSKFQILSTAGGGGGEDDVSEMRERLTAQLTQLDRERRAIEQKVQGQLAALSQLADSMGDQNAERAQLVARSKGQRSLQASVTKHEKTIKDLERKLRADSDGEKNAKRKELEAKFQELTASMRELVDRSKASLTLQVTKSVADSLKNDLAEDMRRASQDVQDAKQELKQFKAAVDIATKARDDAITRVKRAEASVEEFKAKEFGGDEDAFEKRYEDAARTIPEDTIEELEDKIESLKGQLERVVDNPRLLEQYEALKRELAENQRALEALTIEFDEAHARLEERAAGWKDAVEILAKKLSGHFKTFMAGLQYEGEVALLPKGTIDQYEMQMSVSYRQGADVSPLSGTRHSGGERAVATIMYLMALQEMTAAPFRVVDEINQGMDERNERLVFDRVVQSCCGDVNKPQYFLISPKLLQGLRSMEHDDVTVLLVWNGPGLLAKFQLPDLIKSFKRKHKLDGAEDEGKAGSHRKLIGAGAAAYADGDEDDEDVVPLKSAAKGTAAMRSGKKAKSGV
jgi:hypothetical protein